MSKVNLDKLVADVKKLYKADKKALEIISTGVAVKTQYTENDVSPLPHGHPLQVLLGLPGIPYNKLIQVVGKPDCGKSTWAVEAIVKAQQTGIQAILWDAEQKFDADRFTKMGGKPEELLMVKTNETLKGAELIRKYIIAIKEQDPGAKILFVWDSVGASQSRSHAERELDSEKHGQPGQDAKENAQVMKMVVSLINKYPDSIATYMVNQSYAKIGFMQKGDAASGGTKIEYHSSLIIFLKRIKTLTRVVKGVTTKYGIITRATVTKNHLSQTETSVHQLDFKITSAGSEVTESESDNDEE
ncbi:unnamed protein product [Sphagnum balticum]